MDRLTNKNSIFKGGRINGKNFFQQMYNKLFKLEDLEDELGCPLEVVFKALKGIIYENEFGDFCSVQRPRLYFSDDFKCWCFELFLGGYVLKLKDHKKTWWLLGDKESE